MEAKHTPGPWMVEEMSNKRTSFLSIRPINEPDEVAELPDWSEQYRKEMYANARLIAAAPDLLAALIESKHWLRGAGKPSDSACETLFDAEKMIDAAIAKATSK